ncbi:NADH:ubiquinone oxidoreductase, Na translocating, B subunit [candidate division KSB3 bacterium]|uniref:NADH:ubiquinone oxidoreductase, Na translocating, B subunit n=1 Tax=candidate division KSB3 bacterium TaxID=2044937 RepID=A0A2G6E551_9BACT|nr:MAG: NADH:ubiquinone oxidoreductase, Na translocating, B subunit [candidate division KSB3 bacterium]PIE29779.1 MAG: NADH:ubiquinone oxidoreductase, Na translocating, B subunit [candidate division KSB3 bacterium]
MIKGAGEIYATVFETVDFVEMFEKVIGRLPLEIAFLNQKVMRTVVHSLWPAAIGAIYFFGWRVLAVMAVSMLTCVLTEWMFVRNKKPGKVSEAVFVTAVLYAMTLPPTIPFPMVILGAMFGITFGKMAFGGFGMNVFNPALVGRAFVYITFPTYATARWIPAANFSDFPGGFLAWLYSPGRASVEAVTAATPLSAFRSGAESLPSYWQMFFGNTNGQFETLGEITQIGGGSIGESSVFLIALGGIYLLYKKAANWKIAAAFFGAFWVLQSIFHIADPAKAGNVLFGLFAGGVVFAGFYMLTDPVSGPRTEAGYVFFGVLVALLTILIRAYSLFAGGVMFAVLLGNTFSPIIDYAVKNLKNNT